MKKWLKRSLTILAIVCAVVVYLNIGWHLVGYIDSISTSTSQQLTTFQKALAGADRSFLNYSSTPVPVGVQITSALFWPLLLAIIIIVSMVTWSVYGGCLLGGLIWAGIKLLPDLIFTGGLFEIIFGNWISTIISLAVFGIPIYLWIGSIIGIPATILLTRILKNIFNIPNKKSARQMLKELDEDKNDKMFLAAIWPSVVAVLVIGIVLLGGVAVLFRLSFSSAKLIVKTWWRAINFCLK